MERKHYSGAFMVILFVVMTLLTACGSGPGGNDTANSNDDNESGNRGGSTSDKTVVDFWTQSWGDSETEWFEKWIEEYNNSQDDVIVEVEFIPGDAWDQRMTAASAAGTAPDIRMMNYNKIVFSADQGEIQALDDYMDDSVWDDLHENVEDFVSIEDEHYAMPLLVEPSALLYYRKDFFEEAGLDPDSPPTTWDELLQYGRELKADRRSGLVAAGNTSELAWTHWGWQGMIGGHPISEDWSEATINNDEYKELLTLWKTLHDEDILPEQAPAGYTEIQPLADGRTAMQINGSWAINALRTDYQDLVDNIGIAPVPTPDGNQEKTTASLGGWTLTIDGNSDTPQEAADFISWLLAGDTEILVDFFKSATNFSKFAARKSVDEALNEDPEGKNDPWRQLVAEEVIPYAIPEPIYAWEISLAYANAVERVYLQGQDVEESLEQAESEINEYIEANDYAGTNPALQ